VEDVAQLNAREQLLAEGYFGRQLAEVRFIRATRSIPDEALSPPTVKARKLALNTLPRNGMGHDFDFEIGTWKIHRKRLDPRLTGWLGY
jgi:hypothetical protein